LTSKPTNGPKGIKSLLSLGSVSRKIIENASCPVLMMNAEKK